MNIVSDNNQGINFYEAQFDDINFNENSHH